MADMRNQHETAEAVSARAYPEMQELEGLLRTASAVLVEGAAPEPAAGDLLARLNYLAGTSDEIRHRAVLLRAAATFLRIFVLNAPDAPSMVALGAEVDPETAGAQDLLPVGVSGTGLTLREAFEACVGEGVEYLSQFVASGDLIERLPTGQVLAEATPAVRTLWDELQQYRRDPSAQEGAWTVATDLADGRPVRMPADLCFRRLAAERDIDPPWPLSVGCAAAPDLAKATLLGLLELIERDAAALWWRGGRRARLIAADTAAQAEAAQLLVQLRGDASGRRSWLLDITSDIRIPVIAAVSCNEDGFGFCCGLAARPTLVAAARRAIIEMCQMELAYRVVQAKRVERGETVLNETDQRHVCRFTRLAVAHCAALQPLPPPAPSCDFAASDSVSALAEVRTRLAAAGFAPCALDLTRPGLGIAVVRVICPGLQPDPSAPPNARLRAVLADARPREEYDAAIALM
jgi:ribosomal protein S12 methylthiotransferase accessory factor